MKKDRLALKAANTTMLLFAGFAFQFACMAQGQPAQGSVLNFYLMDTGGKPIGDANILVRSSGAACVTDGRGRCSIPNSMPYADIDLTASGFDGIENGFAAPDSQGRIVFVLRSNQEVQAQAERARLRAVEEERSRKEKLAAQKARDAEEEKALAERNRSLVRDLPNTILCAAMGSVLRGEKMPDILYLSIDADAITREVARRRLSINKDQAIRELLVIGMSECTLAASYGYPDDQNRSVGPWGTRTQHVYRALKTYVYTSNGKVTSWQD